MPRQPHQPRLPQDPEFDPDPQSEIRTSRELANEGLAQESLRESLQNDSRTPEQRAIDARDDILDAIARIEDLKETIREGTAVPDAEEKIASLRALVLDAMLELRSLGETVDTDRP